jgi:hypothetical protein
LEETETGKEKLFVHTNLLKLLGQDGNGFARYGA